MVKIRLAKVGKKNRPAYRIVAINSQSKRNGRSLDILGHFDPFQKEAGRFAVDKERLNKWIENGAQLSKAVSDLLDGVYKFSPYHGSTKKT
ncbi:30S ribosomal protein S16 [candidate division WWE3 bacterium CG08_land_8_20_14_0_20_43_13]|uniref:Small ribosomal subunit protein bS16 n=1 Tax=candidate division WWE3 bacterium CG08_land_8_20_14_0_20_43_13 TaxID=1975087 RepID=A0A2H0X826_UNCKA|nr:MAG: 30S ribosomal protein S16 [candidate division WWE3 bacterium CG08_land_8_20_14_0_20_43_13]